MQILFFGSILNAQTTNGELKAKVSSLRLSQEEIEYDKLVESINLDCFAIKAKELISRKLNNGIHFSIRGRRLAQGEALLFKLAAVQDAKTPVELVSAGVSIDDSIFNFFTNDGESGPKKELEAFLPISPAEKIGLKQVIIKISYKTSSTPQMTSSLPIKLNIESGNFKKSHVKKSLKVEQRYTSRLSDKTKAEVTEQVKQIRKALSSSRKGQRYWSLPFIHPTGGTVITSPFYIQRFYNMKPGSPHGGTDFRGRNGHPVQAINNGIVAFAADTFYAGKLIIIDHGDRFFSLYMHQSKLLVKKGERVMKGKVIGRIGSSGLVTGPHLHLGIIMHGIKIDPISLLLL